VTSTTAVPRPRRSWRKLVLFGSVAAAIALLGALAVGELLLRFYDPLPHPLADLRGLYEVSGAGHIQLAAGWSGAQFVEGRRVPIAIDGLGLRGEPPAGAMPPARRAGERRLLVVGDSFVFGQGVDAAAAIPAQLELLLRQRGVDVTVGNAGIAGTGPREWTHSLQRVRQSFGVDAVVAVLFVGNDVLDTLQEPLTVVDGWLLTSGFAKVARESWRFRLRVASRLWDKVETVLGSANLFTMGQHAPIGPGLALGDALFLDRDPQRDAELPFLAEVEARLGGSFDAFAVATRDLPKLIVLLPARSVVLQDYGQLLAANRLDPALHRRGVGHARLRAWLERRGFLVVDLLEPLLARADRAALYLPNDGHFNAAGCGAAAAMLAEDVEALLRR
jgi:lysophospholipase L1-like esterase